MFNCCFQKSKFSKEDIKILTTTNSNLRTEIVSLRTENFKLKDEISKLEKELNKYKQLKINIVNNIRAKARRKYKKHFKLVCAHCKNSTEANIQICHIKPISNFDPASDESEINALSNLIALCANCHLDLDKSKNPEVLKTVAEHSANVESLHLL